MPNVPVEAHLAALTHPTFDVWTDIVTLTLDPGDWLVSGKIMMINGDATNSWTCLYVAATDEYLNMTHRLVRGGFFPASFCDIIHLAVASDVSIRYRTDGVSGIASIIDIAADSNGLFTFVSTWMTSISAVPIDGIPWVRAHTLADVLLDPGQANVPFNSVDLTEGTWLVISTFATTGMNNYGSGLVDHVAGMLANGAELRRYVDDGYAAGQDVNGMFQLLDVITLDGPATISTLAASLGAGNTVHVPEQWSIIDTHGNPVSGFPHTTGTIVAIRIPNSDDARSSVLSADVHVASDQWVDGPSVGLSEGQWIVWGQGHVFSEHPPNFTWAVEIVANGVEYQISPCTKPSDPGNEAGVANVTGILITVPPDGFYTAKLRAYSTSIPGEMQATTIYTALCPEIVWTPGPGPGQAEASLITAVKLPIDLASFTPMKHIRRTLPTSAPTVELYRLTV